MKIKIRYKSPETDVMEIQFLRGETLLHNVFYDIEGLNNKELDALKQEAVAKFLTIFPEITKEEIMRGFSAVDKRMYQLYKETFGGHTRGGLRPNCGRKKGVKSKNETVVYYRRVPPQAVKYLDECLQKFKEEL